MKIIHEPLRYAHDEGHTDVCYSEDGENFITCGADGDIRIWSVNEGEDPHHTCIGEWALSVRQKNDKLYVATGSNEIQILSYPDGERDGVLARSTDPFNHIGMCKKKISKRQLGRPLMDKLNTAFLEHFTREEEINYDESMIAVLAGEGMEINIMDLERCSVVTSFKDLNGPCLSVALCPNARKVAASCGDGKLRIWELESSLLLKEISCFPKVNSFANAKNLCRIDFYPINGTYLAYPENNEIKLLNTNDWSEESLNYDKISAAFSVLQFSPCGKYLAAATVEGDFVIWDFPQRHVFRTTKHESAKAVCGLMWNPKENGEIVYTDIEGQLSIMSNCSRLERIDNEKNDVDENGFTENEVDFGDIQFDDGEEDENAISVEKIKKQYLGSPEPELKALSEASSRSSTPRPRTPQIPMQSPFMPASTPEHLDPRFLCWNDVGIVKCYGNNLGDETVSKTIETEFHDTTFHNSMMLQNYQEYIMGSLSRGALVVANSSQIMVIPLFSSNREWTLKAEEYEEIILVAASENLICFATSNYLIRVCSIFGTQRGVVSTPGPLVTMSAFKNILLVAYHASGVRKNDQCINIKLLKFEGTTVQSHDLGSALGPETTLSWLGFSDMGTPGIMDSSGILSLYPPKCNSWIPFCDTKKHQKSPADGFFVTTVFESYQAVGGIKCKGAVYPVFIPRPTVCELPIEPLFAENGSEKTQMEMNLFTWSNLNVMETDRKFKETALKTFALACKNDLDQRALEFMEIIGNVQILNLGLKYASKLNKRRLAEKLIDLARKLQEDNEEKEDECPKEMHSISGTPDVNTPDQAIIRPSTIGKFSLSKLTPRKRKPKEILQTTSDENNSSNNDNNQSTINTQESLFTEEQSFTEEVPQNPFLKKRKATALNTYEVTPSQNQKNPFLRKDKCNQANPLSLTDQFDGKNCEKIENKTEDKEGGEKRKLSDHDSEKPVEKQRKLDTFMFTKR